MIHLAVRILALQAYVSQKSATVLLNIFLLW